MKSFGKTLDISLKKLFLLQKKLALKWLSTQMIHHSISLDYHVSLQTKKILKDLLTYMTVHITDLQCAVVLLGADPNNDFPEMLRYFGKKDRVNFVHARNVKLTGGISFEESAIHLNMVQLICMKSLVQ